MSALPPKADIAESDRQVRFVPKADISSAVNRARFDHLVYVNDAMMGEIDAKAAVGEYLHAIRQIREIPMVRLRGLKVSLAGR